MDDVARQVTAAVQAGSGGTHEDAVLRQMYFTFKLDAYSKLPPRDAKVPYLDRAHLLSTPEPHSSYRGRTGRSTISYDDIGRMAGELYKQSLALQGYSLGMGGLETNPASYLLQDPLRHQKTNYGV